MNKIVKLSFMLAFCTVCLGLFSSQANAQNMATEVVKLMETHRVAMTSLRSTITMVKRDNNLGDDVPFVGKVQYASRRDKEGRDVDAFVRLDWQKPKQEMISIINKEFKSYDPRTRQAFVGKADSKKVGEKGGGMIQLLASPSREDIKSKYNTEYLGKATTSDGVKAFHIKLTPKVKADYAHIELWVDGNGMPIQGMIVSLNSDTQTIRLSDLEKNITLVAKSFEIIFPKGVKPTSV
jgi:outer membrane lipoprotein-sorting protein